MNIQEEALSFFLDIVFEQCYKAIKNMHEFRVWNHKEKDHNAA